MKNSDRIVSKGFTEWRSLPVAHYEFDGLGEESEAVTSSGGEMRVSSVLKKRRSKMKKQKYKKRSRKNRFKTK